jgi:hypothetical protein
MGRRLQARDGGDARRAGEIGGLIIHVLRLG